MILSSALKDLSSFPFATNSIPFPINLWISTKSWRSTPSGSLFPNKIVEKCSESFSFLLSNMFRALLFIRATVPSFFNIKIPSITASMMCLYLSSRSWSLSFAFSISVYFQSVVCYFFEFAMHSREWVHFISGVTGCIFCKVNMNSGIFNRNSHLADKDLQNRKSVLGKNSRCRVVLEINNSNDFSFDFDWYT